MVFKEAHVTAVSTVSLNTNDLRRFSRYLCDLPVVRISAVPRFVGSFGDLFYTLWVLLASIGNLLGAF